jgi:hypothetical protein
VFPDNSQLKVYSQPIVGPISDLQLLAVVDDEATDMDLSEVFSVCPSVRHGCVFYVMCLQERKILHFLEMVKGLRSVSLDLGVDTGRVTELETWPLIQVTDDACMAFQRRAFDRYLHSSCLFLIISPQVYGLEELGNRFSSFIRNLQPPFLSSD